MYPITRLVKIAIQARAKPKLPFDAISEIHFRCRPWDLDIFMEMNNGRILTLFDLGRTDLAIRTGLVAALKKNRWGLAVAGGSNRFRRRVHLFDKVTLKTNAVGYDERWFYLYQSMWVNGKSTSSGLLRTCVTEKGGAVATERVLKELNASDWQPELPIWVKEWILAEEHRPWPPVHETNSQAD